MSSYRSHSWTAALALAACAVSVAAHAQPAKYPARPVRIVVGFPPGGGVDIIARLLSEPLKAELGQPFVVENRTGAAAMIAAGAAAKAPPDGLTLGIGNLGTHVINPGLYKSLPYDPIRDFLPVTQMIANGSALVGHVKLVPRTLKELIAYARANPDKVNFASPNTPVFLLYLALIARGLMIAANAPTFFSRLLAGAIVLTFFTYAFVNMGMVSGIMPVVGVPLPLISYGGTALVTLFVGIGILMSVQKHRKLVQT